MWCFWFLSKDEISCNLFVGTIYCFLLSELKDVIFCYCYICCPGVAVGAGWQSVVAYVNITSYYLIGIPLGVVLGYVFNFHVKVRIEFQSLILLLCISNQTILLQHDIILRFHYFCSVPWQYTGNNYLCRTVILNRASGVCSKKIRASDNCLVILGHNKFEW